MIYYTILCYITLYYTILYECIQYNTILYYATQYMTTTYNTAQESLPGQVINAVGLPASPMEPRLLTSASVDYHIVA